MKKRQVLFTLKNGKGGLQEYINITSKEIENYLKNDNYLDLFTNEFYKSKTIVLYRFSKTELTKNLELRSLLFGRKNAHGFLIVNETTCNSLAWYSKNVILKTDINTIDKYATYTKNNKGYAVEILETDLLKAVKTDYETDVKQGIDVFSGRYAVQIKASIATEKTKGSFSITNKSIFE